MITKCICSCAPDLYSTFFLIRIYDVLESNTRILISSKSFLFELPTAKLGMGRLFYVGTRERNFFLQMKIIIQVRKELQLGRLGSSEVSTQKEVQKIEKNQSMKLIYFLIGKIIYEFEKFKNL